MSPNLVDQDISREVLIDAREVAPEMDYISF
jgi:hypothetical protein